MISSEKDVNLGEVIFVDILFVQRYITLKRPYLFRTMLRIFSRRSRLVRSTEFFLPKYNQRIQGLKRGACYAFTCISTTERNRSVV